MDNCNLGTSVEAAAASESQQVKIDLQYLSPSQAQRLIKMFDSPEAYAENFSALKAITKGLYKILTDTNVNERTQVGRMFSVVNNMQGILLLDDMNEVWRITEASGLTPYVGFGRRPQKGVGDE